MFKKTLLACLLITSAFTAHAEEFEPFGIKIGEHSDLYPTNFEPTVLEPVKVEPPKPVDAFFNVYNVYFNDEKLVRKVEATGNITNSQYSCGDIAKSLNTTFLETYNNAEKSVQNNAMYAYTVKDNDQTYSAYIECDNNTIRYVMFNPSLEKIRDNVTNPQQPEVNL